MPHSIRRISIRISNGAVTTGGGTGAMAGTGRVQFSGRDNSFRGVLNANGTGSGTYSGRCIGTFTAVQTKP